MIPSPPVSMKLSKRLISSAGSRRESRKRARPCTDAPSSIIKRSCPSTDVSLRIAQQLLTDKKQNESNIVFCPLSISVLLSLVGAGSGSETLDQFLTFLGSESLNHVNSFASNFISVVSPGDGGPKLSFASGFWVDRSLSLRNSFKQVVDSFHKATVLESVDFKNKAKEVTKEVNLWVEKETNGIIKEAIPPEKINTLTRLVLANALYFKGRWEDSFKAQRRKDSDFHLLNGNTAAVPFMFEDYKWKYLCRCDGFKVMKLPYKHSADELRFSMCFYLPDEKDGLPSLIEKVTSEPEVFKTHAPCSMKCIRKFRIPKFKISFGFEASEVIKSLRYVWITCVVTELMFQSSDTSLL